MAMKELKPIPIANIVRVEIENYPAGGGAGTPTKQYRIKTADEITCKPFVSEGKEDILRSFNTIMAQNKLEDLVLGYELTLKEVAMSPEVFALIDGGSVTYKTGTTFQSYEGPAVGQETKRELFKIMIYSEQKDANGGNVSYLKTTFEYGKGKPAEFSFKNGEWVTPSYSIKTAAKIGEKPIKIEVLDTLPE